MAERADFTISVQGTGSLSPASQVVVTPEVSGIIDSVPVTEGQNVEFEISENERGGRQAVEVKVVPKKKD
jgi:hypothetical protein